MRCGPQLLLSAFALTFSLFAQSPAFEVASIKPSAANAESSIRHLPGGRFVVTNYSPGMLIVWAYDLTNDRLIGAPGWLDAVRYDVTAKAPDENPARGQLELMMQSLLAERFGLRCHHETREATIYALTVDKDGARVHVTDPADGVSQNPFNMTDRGRLTGTKVTAAMLAKVLSGQLGRPVQDMTGMKGIFDFTLEWTPDIDPDSSTAGTRSSIFTALREQLGFRLDSHKAMTDVLVIDDVGKTPSEN